MCLDAIYSADIGWVMYGQSEKSLRESTGKNEQNPTMDLECKHVFPAGQRRMQVVGTLMEEETKKLQEGFWDKWS